MEKLQNGENIGIMTQPTKGRERPCELIRRDKNLTALRTRYAITDCSVSAQPQCVIWYISYDGTNFA